MKSVLDDYLGKNGLNRSVVSRRTGLQYTTLQRSSVRDAIDINPRVMVAVAEAFGKTPGEVFDELLETEMSDHMTIATTKILFAQLFPDELVSVEDVGDDRMAVVVEIELKGKDDPIRVAINFDDETQFNKSELLEEISYALTSFEDTDGEYTPKTSGVAEWIDVEQMGISQESFEYLEKLSKKVMHNAEID